MKNLAMTNGFMNKRITDNMNANVLQYVYQTSQSMSHVRYHHRSFFINNSVEFSTTPFECDNIMFNMITCPQGYVEVTETKFENQSLTEEREWQRIDKSFMLGETEVTQDLFKQIMNFNYSICKGRNNPVEAVTWYDCAEFCNRLSDYFNLEHYYEIRNPVYGGNDNNDNPVPLSIHSVGEIIENKKSCGFRLPYAREWTLAALSGTNNKFAGTNQSDDVGRYAWIRDNSDYQTHPVAQKLPNEWGFYDMNGNVFEWTNDVVFIDISNNEITPYHCRVYGGSYGDYDLSYYDITKSNIYSTSNCSDVIGFRIARNVN